MDGQQSTGLSEQEKQDAIAALLGEVLDRRGSGEYLPDEQVIADHPRLQPELGEELASLGSIHRVLLAAQKAGMTTAAKATGVAAPDPPQGLIVQGYTIQGQIGGGGQGKVYRAIQQSTNRRVAIKVLDGGSMISSQHRARFDRESEILARLEHPHIVGIVDRGRTADGSWFLVMPFIEGCSLEEYLRQLQASGSVEVRRLLELFIQIARAMGEAHRHGIVHRDLKPANIRVDLRGEPHIIDFGLARLQEDMLGFVRAPQNITAVGQIIGSLPWSSPEQVSQRDEHVDIRTDVYAMGVMLYQGLTGQFPYPVTGMIHQVLSNIVQVQPLPPSEVRPSAQVDRELDAIVLKALAKSPAQRQRSAEELAEDLERYLHGERHPAGLVPGKVPWWWKAAAIGVLAMLAGGVVIGYGSGMRHKPGWRGVALPALTNSVGMRLVEIPAGSFMMGSPTGQVEHASNERLHSVSIERPFSIAVTEVTQNQYLAVMGKFPIEQTFVGGDLPVHNVNWKDADEFCRALSAREKRKYRLPTEEEWEYAARASAINVLYGGNGNLEEMGWYAGNSGGRPHPVGISQPNAWGLYDMHGNVAEFCQSAYWSDYPFDGKETRPDPPVVPHAVRGGSFASTASQCRSAARDISQASFRYLTVGFRVVLEQ